MQFPELIPIKLFVSTVRVLANEDHTSSCWSFSFSLERSVSAAWIPWTIFSDIPSKNWVQGVGKEGKGQEGEGQQGEGQEGEGQEGEGQEVKGQ